MKCVDGNLRLLGMPKKLRSCVSRRQVAWWISLAGKTARTSENFRGAGYVIPMDSVWIYPLVNIQKTMEMFNG